MTVQEINEKIAEKRQLVDSIGKSLADIIRRRRETNTRVGMKALNEIETTLRHMRSRTLSEITELEKRATDVPVDLVFVESPFASHKPPGLVFVEAEINGKSVAPEQFNAEWLDVTNDDQHYKKLRIYLEPKQKRPLLGLATTDELLKEIQARMEVHGFGSYRPVDSVD